MATRSFSVESVVGGVRRITWTGLTDDTSDDGSPWTGEFDAIRNVQVTGTFGTGGNVRIEGTNAASPSSYGLLHDTAGSDLDLGDNRVEQIQEGVATLRPRVTAGDGTTDLTVVVTEVTRGVGV